MKHDDSQGKDKAGAPLGRRKFLVGGLAAAGAAACGSGAATGSGPAVHSGRKVRWRLASSFPSSLDTIYGAAEVMADRVREMSGGDFDIRVSQAGELVPGLAVMDGVEGGACQMGQTGGYYYTGKDAALAFDTCLPFGLTARQQTAWLLEGGGAELLDPVYADFGCKALVGGNTGAQMGGWFTGEVNSLADLNGLKMRIPGQGGKVMDALGVTVQALAGGEIFPALERGAIDATEWVGPYDDEKLGFYKIAKNYYYPGWWEPGPNLSFLINRAEWDKLPAEYRAMLHAAAAEGAAAMTNRYDAKNPAAWERLKQTGITVRRFPDDMLTAAREAAEDLMSTEAGADPRYAKILAAWRDFREEAFSWFGAAELAYANFAMGGFALDGK